MPVTGPIPLPQSGMDVVAGGMNNIMRNILARQQMAQGDVQQRRAIEQQQRALAQADSHFRQQQALRQQQEKRMAGMGDIQRQMAQLQMQKLEMETDPAKKAAYIKTLIESSQNFGGTAPNMSSGGMTATGSPGGMTSTQQPDQGFMGRGMFPAQDEQPMSPSQGQAQPQQMGQPGQYSPQQLEALRSQFLKMATGLDVNAEPPMIKAQREQQQKMDLEKYKSDQKMALEKQKAAFADAKTKQKTINDAKADIPHLEETLRSLNIMKKIAKNNPDLFGHWLQGHEMAARRTSNPNAGAWQAYGVDPIVATEMKLSSRGNVPALKFAIANKPNFGENQAVALSKIDASIDKIKHAIAQSRKLSGEGSSEEGGSVVVINPKGERFTTTVENAKYLPEGWKRG